MDSTEPDGLDTWRAIQERIAELLNGGLAPADPGDVRYVEYQALREALNRLEWEAGRDTADLV